MPPKSASRQKKDKAADPPASSTDAGRALIARRKRSDRGRSETQAEEADPTTQVVKHRAGGPSQPRDNDADSESSKSSSSQDKSSERTSSEEDRRRRRARRKTKRGVNNHFEQRGNISVKGNGTCNNIGQIIADTFNINNSQNNADSGAGGSEHPPEPQRRVKPTHTIPFHRDDNFVEREGFFEKIDQLLSSANFKRWAALYGLSGIGKSRLANEYAYRLRDTDSDIWVFHVQASTRTTFIGSFKNAVGVLRLPGFEDPKTDFLSSLELWLRDETNGQWLMIVDGADDIGVLSAMSNVETSGTQMVDQPLFDYIPQVSHGRLLVTTSNRDTAAQLMRDEGCMIKVEQMTPVEALTLLERRITIRAEEQETAHELVNRLDCIPMAVSQVGAYLEVMKAQMTVVGYLELYKRSEEVQNTLLRLNRPQLGQDLNAQKSVLVSWGISFQAIKDRDPKAAEIFMQLSMFHHQDIPREFLCLNAKMDPLEMLSLWESLSLLERFCFITSTLSSNDHGRGDLVRLGMHRLLQQASKWWMQTDADSRHDERGILALITVICSLIPAHKPGHVETFDTLLVHAEHVSKWRPDDTTWLEEQSSQESDPNPVKGSIYETLRGLLFYLLALRSALAGRPKITVHYAQATIASVQDFSVLDPVKVGFCKNLIANACSSLDDLECAKQYHQEAVQLFTGHYGQTHGETLSALASLALSLKNSPSGMAESEALLKQVIDCLTVHNRQWSDTQISLAELYVEQKRFTEAEQIIADISEIQDMQPEPGAGDEYLMKLMSALGSIYTESNRLRDAKRVYLDMEKSIQRVLSRHPPYQPWQSSALSEVGHWYDEQGEHNKASTILLQEVRLLERELGRTHLHTCKKIVDLSFTYINSRDWHRAEITLREAIPTMARELGKDHDLVEIALGHLDLAESGLEELRAQQRRHATFRPSTRQKRRLQDD